ncbi:MAG: GNAT family N-acetyltransferase [Chitinivibrionales bacterium]|nr:GNAT family N-acetyltransferase [Chitinivibrionales bacterium]
MKIRTGAATTVVPTNRAMPVSIEPVATVREKQFLEAVKRSHQLHYPWVKPPATAQNFRAYIERMSGDSNAGFFILASDGGLAGVINLNNIVLGGFKNAYLGYYGFAPYGGCGVMTAGLKTVLRHVFTKMHLHRLEANIQPTNVKSIQLVQRCGFSQEGFSVRYLKINGRWRDHQRWALTVENWHSQMQRP